MAQIAQITESTRRGARGLILPASTAIGNPSEDTLLRDTISELKRLGLSRARWPWTLGSTSARPARPSKITTSTPTAAGRPTGNRRSTRWLLITDEDRIAQRAAELERLMRARPDDRTRHRRPGPDLAFATVATLARVLAFAHETETDTNRAGGGEVRCTQRNPRNLSADYVLIITMA